MEPTTTKCRELICCCACLKEVYDTSALDLCLSVPQIPLLTAVLMLLIYKALTSISKPLWCCWDVLLSPFSIRGCWESLVISWDHRGLWTKLGIDRGALNSQPSEAEGRGSSTAPCSAGFSIAISHTVRTPPRFPSWHRNFPYHLVDQAAVQNTACLLEWAVAC